jgi:ppGpp synthetase/RelA/SpoT-type nucleotidyltranferase
LIVQLPYQELELCCATAQQAEWWEDMAWTERKHSKGEIDRAGEALIALGKDDPAREEALVVIDNWRACHAYPLQVIKMTLLNRANKVSPSALIAQRMKRLPSIEIKLLHNPNMKLSQMQDVGGCRAVLPNVKMVYKLVRVYKEFHVKAGKSESKTRSSWDGSDAFDYIRNPKPDGYRSVHLVFRFQSPSPERKVFNGQRIEIQIRSRLQHAWATAVETAQLFTGQALKARVKDANEDWLRFFVLTSAAFARREKSPPVPDAPENMDDLVQELQQIVDREKIVACLLGWNNTIHYFEEPERRDVHTFLMRLDPNNQSLRVWSFKREQLVLAQEQYKIQEKEAESDPLVQVVLVSVESMEALRKAYPNYYVDTMEFVEALQKELARRK